MYCWLIYRSLFCDCFRFQLRPSVRHMRTTEAEFEVQPEWIFFSESWANFFQRGRQRCWRRDGGLWRIFCVRRLLCFGRRRLWSLRPRLWNPPEASADAEYASPTLLTPPLRPSCLSLLFWNTWMKWHWTWIWITMRKCFWRFFLVCICKKRK